MKLLAIIINYKTAEMTLDAISALMKELIHIPDSYVTVIDNDSQDGSVERLTRGLADKPWANRVTVVAAERNGGFAYGVNQAVTRNLASGDPADYFYLLNSDAFPDENSVRVLLRFMENHQYVGTAGSYIHGPDGDTHLTAFRFPSVVSEFEAGFGLGVVTRLLGDWVVQLPLPTRTCKVDWVAGASMIIRRRVFEEVGLFDETYFLYYEETDFCRRAMLKGFPTYYVVESSVTHIGSVSTGMKNKERRVPKYWFDSRRHYFTKNHGQTYLWAANVIWAGSFSLWRVRQTIQRKADPHPPKLLTDFVKHNFLSRH